MTQFSDTVYVGPAPTGPISFSQPAHGGTGVPASPLWSELFVPVAASVTAVAGTQTVGTAAATFAIAGGLATNGVAFFPQERNVTITGLGTEDISARSITITAVDRYGRTWTETLAGPNGTATVLGAKTAVRVVSATLAAGTATGTVNVGMGNRYGFPFRVDVQSQIFVGRLGAGTGFDGTTGIVVADATSPATSTTGNVRGYWTPNGTPNGTLVAHIAGLYTPTQSGVNGSFATQAQILGVTQA